MKKVLWLSRHAMTSEQKEGLTKVFNGQVQVEVLDETINEETITKLVDLGYDAYAVVLPAGLLSKFYAALNSGQTLLVPLSKRVLTKDPNGGESKVTFVYNGWEVIDKFIYESHVVK